MPDAEEALGELAAGGLGGAEQRAWELFDAAWPAVVRWLGATMRIQRVPQELAEDAGQAALLRIWRARMDYRGSTTGELLAWSRRIVQREVARLAGARGAPTAGVEAELEPPGPDTTSSDVLARDEQRALSACLDELDAVQREVIEYLYSPDAPTERELASILARSKSRVNALRQAALRQLEACLRRKGIAE